ncbi:rRNA maturation RNase YbeY [Verrucomicrobiota bacterium]
MGQVCRLDRDKDWKEISVLLTNDAEISVINQRHLAKFDTTDVISFRYDPIPGEGTLFSGEIIVNVERALKPARGWSPSKELALYIAHGCNHLLGESDSDTAGHTRMRRRELRWLKKANELELVEDLMEQKES